MKKETYFRAITSLCVLAFLAIFTISCASDEVEASVDSNSEGIEDVEILAEIMEDPSISPKDRMTACLSLIEHGHGKAVDRIQVQTMTGAGSNAASMPKALLDARVASLIEADFEDISDV